MTDKITTPPVSSEDEPSRPAENTVPRQSTEVPPLQAARAADASDVPPPPAVEGKGLLGQSTPDVATGSTPVTRRDD